MEALLGTTIGVFAGVTVCLTGFAAYMTGQALARGHDVCAVLIADGAVAGVQAGNGLRLLGVEGKFLAQPRHRVGRGPLGRDPARQAE